mmetsp:Transcript_65645/g.131805  ORF Transcript_65645/g.131805 Transcript_65645/m.131805 type:complete len:223 (-) Transcript_65645:633-1301(-)
MRSSTARSRTLGTFVARITATRAFSVPVWCRKTESAFRASSLMPASAPRPRRRKASASSMNNTKPFLELAAQEKSLCNSWGPSRPNGPKSPPDMMAYSKPDCRASVRAKSVFPVPGGPCRSRCLKGVPFCWALRRAFVVHFKRSESSSSRTMRSKMLGEPLAHHPEMRGIIVQREVSRTKGGRPKWRSITVPATRAAARALYTPKANAVRPVTKVTTLERSS